MDNIYWRKKPLLKSQIVPENKLYQSEDLNYSRNNLLNENSSDKRKVKPNFEENKYYQLNIRNELQGLWTTKDLNCFRVNESSSYQLYKWTQSKDKLITNIESSYQKPKETVKDLLMHQSWHTSVDEYRPKTAYNKNKYDIELTNKHISEAENKLKRWEERIKQLQLKSNNFRSFSYTYNFS